MSQLNLPPTPYLPGISKRPSDQVFAGLKDMIATGNSPDELAQSPLHAAAIQAFQRGYFWEAHELWEPVWLKLPPASAEKLLLKGLIQLANARLKSRMGRDAAAKRILLLADKAINEAFHRQQGPLMGMARRDVEDLQKMHYNAYKC